MAVSASRVFDPGVAKTPAEERDFFNALRLSNRTFKTTAAHCLDDLNAALIAALKEAGVKPREALDVAASSGVTSVELVDALVEAGFDTRLASDVSLHGRLVRLSRNHYVLTDQSGDILQLVMGVSLRPWPRRLDMATGNWLVRRIANRVARASLSGSHAGQAVMRVSDTALAHPRISFVDDNIVSDAADELSRRFDLVRAANVLNRDYFDEADLGRAVASIKERMRGPGSVLMVARTLEDRSNHATIFRLNDKMDFEIVSRFGNGSEIENIVLASADTRHGRRN